MKVQSLGHTFPSLPPPLSLLELICLRSVRGEHAQHSRGSNDFYSFAHIDQQVWHDTCYDIIFHRDHQNSRLLGVIFERLQELMVVLPNRTSWAQGWSN